MNISHSEVFDCLYFWIYIFKFCRFFIHKGVSVFIKGLKFFFVKTTTAIIFFVFFLFKTSKHNTKYKINLLSARLHTQVSYHEISIKYHIFESSQSGEKNLLLLLNGLYILTVFLSLCTNHRWNKYHCTAKARRARRTYCIMHIALKEKLALHILRAAAIPLPSRQI